MRSHISERFRQLLVDLPRPIQRQARAAYRLFRQDPSHPSLHFKPVGRNNPNIYSARVGLHYRVIGVREGNEIIWFWIGSHAEYDQVIDRF